MQQFSSVEKHFFDQQSIKDQTSQIPYIVLDNFPQLGLITSLRFLEWAYEYPEGVISLPTGKTPEYFIKWTHHILNNWDSNEIKNIRKNNGLQIKKKPDLSKLKFVQIDEFYPLNPNQHNSFYNYVCKYYLDGFGLSYDNALLINSDNIEILSSEGGHIEFAPKNSKEWELKVWLKNFLNLERISCERIISGEGLCNIAKWRFSYSDAINHSFQNILEESKTSKETKKKLASEICKFSAQGDPLLQEIENIWLNNYASYLGDVALHELCFGGLWISGGTAPKHLKNFKSDSFLKHFSDKGRYKDILKSIPVKVILDEEFGLFSAACRAKMLLKT